MTKSLAKKPISPSRVETQPRTLWDKLSTPNRKCKCDNESLGDVSSSLTINKKGALDPHNPRPILLQPSARSRQEEQKENRLVRKIDAHMLPGICILYMLNHLDRSNIANARIGGMEEDLHLSSSDYSTVVLIFFVGYLLAEVPSNMMLPHMRPSLFLPALSFTWGLIVTLMSFVKTKQSLITARFFLGLVESGFFPGVVLLLSSWYRKGDLAKRIAFMYCCGLLSGALGGLLSGVIIKSFEGICGIQGWRWLYIIEGCITVSAAIPVVFLLPDWPMNTKWLSEEEKALMMLRFEVDPVELDELSSKLGSAVKPSQRDSLMAVLKDWRTYLFSFMYLMILSSQVISYFLPTIVVSLGYHGQQTQFMTVPPYLVACVCTLAVSISMDRFGEEMSHVAVPIGISGLLYALCLVVTAPVARYSLVCVAFAGTYGALPVALAWVSKVAGSNKEKSAITVAVVNTVGNTASFYGSFLWPKSQEPTYVLGFSMIATFAFSCAISAVVMKMLLGYFPQPRKTTQSRSILRTNGGEDKH